MKNYVEGSEINRRENSIISSCIFLISLM